MGSGPSTASDIHPSINYIQVFLNNMKQIFKPVGNAFVKTGSLISERMPSKRNINNFISVSKIKSQQIASNSMKNAIKNIKQPQSSQQQSSQSQSSQQNINELNGGKRKKPSENKKKPSKK